MPLKRQHSTMILILYHFHHFHNSSSWPAKLCKQKKHQKFIQFCGVLWTSQPINLQIRLLWLYVYSSLKLVVFLTQFLGHQQQLVARKKLIFLCVHFHFSEIISQCFCVIVFWSYEECVKKIENFQISKPCLAYVKQQKENEKKNYENEKMSVKSNFWQTWTSFAFLELEHINC